MRLPNPMDLMHPSLITAGETSDIFDDGEVPRVIRLPAVKRFSVVRGFSKRKGSIRAVSWEFRNHHRKTVETDIPEASLQVRLISQTLFTRPIVDAIVEAVPYAHMRAVIDLAQGTEGILSRQAPNLFRDEQGVVRVEWTERGWEILTHSRGSAVIHESGTRVFSLVR